MATDILADIPIAERSFRFHVASFSDDVEVERKKPGSTAAYLRSRSGHDNRLVDLALRTYWAAVITAAARPPEPHLHPCGERCHRCASEAEVAAHLTTDPPAPPPVIHWGLPDSACPLVAQDPKDCDGKGQGDHEHIYVGG